MITRDSLFIKSIFHVLETPFFKLVLSIFLLLSIALFFIQKHIVFPVFEQIQTASIESEALRTAQHLKSSLRIQHNTRTLMLSDNFEKDMQDFMQDFQLVKIKFFDSSGMVVYSSDSKDIGIINTHDYFFNLVAKGKIFSKIVKEKQTTMEGQILPVSVAEVYVPILNNDTFNGAFEIYYDITDQNNNILRNRLIFKGLSYSTWFFLTVVFAALLLKASQANILKRRAEEDLTDTNKWLEDSVLEKTQEIKATQVVSVHALAALAEYYDQDTGEHLERIQLYVKTLLEYLETTPNQYSEYIQRNSSYIKEIVLASLLHDIGKTAIPAEILIKPSKLSPKEFEIVKDHTVIAGEALEKANIIFKTEFGKDSYLALARDIAMHHHEKWNGGGYPHNLKGHDIPLSARITAIADVYDALTSERPYKEAWSHQRAFEEIVNGSGSHFDPELVAAFIKCGQQFKSIAEGNVIHPLS